MSRNEMSGDEKGGSSRKVLIVNGPLSLDKHYIFLSLHLVSGIDENGTEAAAATAVIMAEAMSMTFPVLTPPRVVFNANHPFLFAVQHVPSKTILFFGDLQVPNSD